MCTLSPKRWKGHIRPIWIKDTMVGGTYTSYETILDNQQGPVFNSLVSYFLGSIIF